MLHRRHGGWSINAFSADKCKTHSYGRDGSRSVYKSPWATVSVHAQNWSSLGSGLLLIHSFLCFWLPHLHFHEQTSTGTQVHIGIFKNPRQPQVTLKWVFHGLLWLSPSTQVSEAQTHPLISDITCGQTTNASTWSSPRGCLSGADATRQSTSS